jgi:hypothetical protein
VDHRAGWPADHRRGPAVGREAAELHQAYEAYLEDWGQQKRQAGEDAYQRTFSEEYQRQLAAPLPASDGSNLLSPF